MRSVLKEDFEDNDRFTVESVHETVYQQYLSFCRAKDGVPDFAPDAGERRQHHKKWKYINGQFAAWLSQLDQQSIVGWKLNEKLSDIREQGQKDNWEEW